MNDLCSSALITMLLRVLSTGGAVGTPFVVGRVHPLRETLQAVQCKAPGWLLTQQCQQTTNVAAQTGWKDIVSTVLHSPD